MISAGAQPIMGGGVSTGQAIGSPTTGFSTDRIGAVLDQAGGAGAPIAPSMAPMSPALGGQGAVIGSNVGAPMGAMPAAAPFPAFAANGARDEVYLSDPTARQLLVVDAAQPQVKQRVALGFTPSYLAWLGIAR